MSDYWDNEDEYDDVAAELKQTLRDAVTLEVKNTIQMLQTQNRELKSKLENLEKLEGEAIQAKHAANREGAAARRDAERVVRKEKLGEILAAIDERLHLIEREYLQQEKCDHCNDNRRIPYTLPSGRESSETCACAANHTKWVLSEAVAHEVAIRGEKISVWWVSGRRWGENDELYAKTMKRSLGVSLAELCADPTNYAYADAAAGQVVVDALNKAEASHE